MAIGKKGDNSISVKNISNRFFKEKIIDVHSQTYICIYIYIYRERGGRERNIGNNEHIVVPAQ